MCLCFFCRSSLRKSFYVCISCHPSSLSLFSLPSSTILSITLQSSQCVSHPVRHPVHSISFCCKYSFFFSHFDLLSSPPFILSLCYMCYIYTNSISFLLVQYLSLFGKYVNCVSFRSVVFLENFEMGSRVRRVDSSYRIISSYHMPVTFAKRMRLTSDEEKIPVI